MRRLGILLFLVGITLGLTGCDRKGGAYPGPRYEPVNTRKPTEDLRLMVFPRVAAEKQAQSIEPLRGYLSRRLPNYGFIYETSRDQAYFEKKYRERVPAVIVGTPFQAVDALKYGYSVVAMAGRPEDSRGVMVARKDQVISDLPQFFRGKRIAFAGKASISACIIQQDYLHRNGLLAGSDYEALYLGSLYALAQFMDAGKADVCCMSEFVWQYLLKHDVDFAKGMRVIWKSDPFPGKAVLVRDDLPIEVRKEIGRVLLDAKSQPDGQAICEALGVAGFGPASDTDYAPVREFITRFERDVRKVDSDEI